MKKLLILALLLATPALAQRGPGTRPLQNYAETCTVYGTVNDGDSCSGYPKQWCVNYTTNIIYACSPTTALWEAVGSGGGTGGFDDWGDFSGFGGTVTSGTFLVGGTASFSFTGAGLVTANGLACTTDCVTLGSETSGSYAAGDAEAGNATGLACTTCVAPATEISSASSAVWAANIDDETGSSANALVVFNQSPTIATPTLTGFTASRCARFNSSGVLVPSSSGDCDSGDTGGGGGDSILVAGTNVTDGTGINFRDTTGVDLTFDSGPVPDTLDVGIDLTEVNDATFGDDSDTSNVVTVRVSGATDPTYTHSSTGVELNRPLTVSDQTVVGEKGNGLVIYDNETDLTNNPTCALTGVAGELSIQDSAEVGSDVWDVCEGTSVLWRFPTASATATNALFATSTSGAAAYRPIATSDLPATGTWVSTGGLDFGGGSVEIGNGAAPTLDATGEIGLDTTADQVCYYNGTVVKCLDPRDALSVVLFSPTATDDPIIFKAPWGMTITNIDCIVGAATSVAIDVQECDSTGASCTTVDASITCDTNGAADDGSLTNAGIDSGDWLKIDVGTPTGTIGFVSITVKFIKVRE